MIDCEIKCEHCGVGLSYVDMHRLKGRYYHASRHINHDHERALVQHPHTGFCRFDDRLGAVQKARHGDEMSLDNNNQHNVTAYRIGRLMRRFRQLAHIQAHFERVLREGKRELSGMELHRAQQIAGELGSVAATLREYRHELPDVPGVLEVE